MKGKLLHIEEHWFVEYEGMYGSLTKIPVYNNGDGVKYSLESGKEVEFEFTLVGYPVPKHYAKIMDCVIVSDALDIPNDVIDKAATKYGEGFMNRGVATVSFIRGCEWYKEQLTKNKK